MIRATWLGHVAANALATSTSGMVDAVFRHGIYLRLRTPEHTGQYVFVGNDDLPLGPLNVRTLRPPATDWSTIDRQRLVVSEGSVQLACGSAVRFDTAQVWHPPAVPPCSSAEQLRRGVSALDASMSAAGDSPDSGPRHAATQLIELRQEMRSTLGASAEALASARWPDALRGLGNGLTPSGDDMLVGATIALHGLAASGAQASASPLLAALSIRIAANLDAATTPISAAHLRAAIAGSASASLHEVLHEVLRGAPDPSRLKEHLRKTLAVGHDSGADALAGLGAALGAAVDQQTCSTAQDLQM